jgi:hypothetical protein
MLGDARLANEIADELLGEFIFNSNTETESMLLLVCFVLLLLAADIMAVLACKCNCIISCQIVNVMITVFLFDCLILVVIALSFTYIKSRDL